MANVTNLGNKYYSTASLNGLPLNGSQFLSGYVNPNFVDPYVNLGMLRPLAAPQSTQQTATPTAPRQPFTPNAINQQQLAGSGNGLAPQWMMDAYTNKIGQMGGNANAPIPFGVTPSGFPGMPQQPSPQQQPAQQTTAVMPAGKTAPYASIISGLQGAIGGATNAAKGAI